MNELLNPYLSQALTVVIQIAALALFYGLGILRRKVEAYLQARLGTSQSEMLQLLGKEAYAFAETAYNQLRGPEKLSAALDYLEQQAKRRGIPFDPDAARAAIEKAWLETEGIRKKQSINISAPTIQTGTAVSLDQKTPDTYLG